MPAASSLKVTVDLTRDLDKAIGDLLRKDLLIGIPGEATPRIGANGKPEVSNALVGYVQEHGDDEKHIPPRPFLMPGIEAAKVKIADGFEQAGKDILAGSPGALEKGLTAAGMAAVAQVKQTILDGNFAPLSDNTLAARARRLTSGGKLSQSETSKAARREIESRASGSLPSSDAKPLLDTRSMFNSITYVLRDKGKK